MSIAVFADVHGESKKLKDLIRKIKGEFGNIQLYSTGDLIDRGPDSKGVIDICIGEDVLSVIGNHDDWLRSLTTSTSQNTFPMCHVMGGKSTALSYGVTEVDDVRIMDKLKHVIPPSHTDYLLEQPLYRMVAVDGVKYWITHSGVNYCTFVRCNVDDEYEMMNTIVSSNLRDDILWLPPITSKFVKTGMYEFKNGIQIFGHSPVVNPIINKRFIALDTGCGTCSPFNLSAIILPEKIIINS